MLNIIQKEQTNVPAAVIAFLMQQKKVVTLKNSKKILQIDYLKIKSIEYPYVLLKEDGSADAYLACTLRSCFAIEKEFKNIKKSIEENIRD